MRPSARWNKIVKDIWVHKSRSLLVILSIAVGVAAVGMINNAGIIVRRELSEAFTAGNPALLQIYISPFQEELASAVEAMREIEFAEARRTIGATVYRENGFGEDIILNVVPDFGDLRVNKFTVESGTSIPGIREILIERQSAEGLGVTVGDKINIEMPNDRRYALKVVGIVHDVYIMPYTLLGDITGYITMETLEWMGETGYYDRLDIVGAGDKYDRQYVLEMGELARDRVIEQSGYQVGTLQIPGLGSDPGDHWAHNQMTGMLLILKIMGIMAIFLSGGLVINTVSAILTQQIKQIGIMRSIGAVRAQIAGMYVINMLIFSVMGLVIAVPLGLLGAWWLSDFVAGFINFDLSRVDLPLEVLLTQISLGLLMPVGVALVPIIAGTRISVYDAIYQYGLGSEGSIGWVEKLLSKIRALKRPLILSLRNTFRHKERLAFTLITLTLAGAMFVAVFSTHASLLAQINEFGHYVAYDAALNVPGANKYTVEREALRIPIVNFAEGWADSNVVIIRLDESESEEFTLVGLSHDAVTIEPLLLDGRWLQPGDTRQIVVNDDLLNKEPDISVGDQIILKVDKRKISCEVVGIVSKHLYSGRIYMEYEAFGKFTGRQNKVDVVRVRANSETISSKSEQDAIAEKLEERFENAGLSKSSSHTRHSIFAKFTDVFDIILIVLVIMALVLAIVGGLGLTGAMGMNVLERTREIGVLRAVGASNVAVRRIVVIEGVIVSLVSWVLGAILSGPAGRALAAAVVDAVMESDLNYQYSFAGLLAWLLIVIVIGILTSLAPARNATQLTVREVLDYE